MRDPLNEYIGIKLLDLIIGFTGSIVALSIWGEQKFVPAVGTVMAGLGCAITLPSWVQHWWAYPPALHNGVVFFLGLGGMIICKKIFKTIHDIQLARFLRSRRGGSD